MLSNTSCKHPLKSQHATPLQTYLGPVLRPQDWGAIRGEGFPPWLFSVCLELWQQPWGASCYIQFCGKLSLHACLPWSGNTHKGSWVWGCSTLCLVCGLAPSSNPQVARELYSGVCPCGTSALANPRLLPQQACWAKSWCHQSPKSGSVLYAVWVLLRLYSIKPVAVFSLSYHGLSLTSLPPFPPWPSTCFGWWWEPLLWVCFCRKLCHLFCQHNNWHRQLCPYTNECRDCTNPCVILIDVNCSFKFVRATSHDFRSMITNGLHPEHCDQMSRCAIA